MYFVNLLITIITESYKFFTIEFFDFDNLMIKSVIIFFYKMSNNFITYVLLYMLFIKCLFFWHYIHFEIYFIT